MKIKYLTIILLLLANFAFADEQRLTTLFKSENGKFTLQYFKKHWKLKNELGKTLYSIKDKGYTSMTIFVSNDGERLVVFGDFMEGHRLGQRMGIAFFKNGVQVNSYKLTDLVTDTCNVLQSIWHTTWTLEDYSLIRSDSIFSIATFEFKEIEFNTYTGQIVKNKRPKPFDKNTLIVIGEFKKGESSKCAMSILKYIYGPSQPNDTLTFITESFGIGKWRQTLMIKDGIDVTPDRFRKGFIGSTCWNKKTDG